MGFVRPAACRFALIVTIGLLLAACTEGAAPAPSVFTWSPFPRTAPPASVKPNASGATAKPTTTRKPSSSTKPTSPRRIEITEARFAIEVPKGYLALSNGNTGPTEAQIAAFKKQSQATEAEIRAALDGVTTSFHGAESVVAYDPTTLPLGSGKVIFMAVISGRYIGTSLENYERVSLRQLEEDGIHDVDHDIVQLPIGKAVRFAFDTIGAGPGGSNVPLRWLLYAVIDGGRQHMLMFVAPRTNYASRHPVFMEMVRSLEIL